MIIQELDAAIRAVCPILGVDGAGNISFDATATAPQIAAAQAVVAVNLSKLNGQPSTIPKTMADFKADYNGLSAAQKAALTGIAIVAMLKLANSDPDLQAQLQLAGISISLTKPNPLG